MYLNSRIKSMLVERHMWLKKSGEGSTRQAPLLQEWDRPKRLNQVTTISLFAVHTVVDQQKHRTVFAGATAVGCVEMVIRSLYASMAHKCHAQRQENRTLEHTNKAFKRILLPQVHKILCNQKIWGTYYWSAQNGQEMQDKGAMWFCARGMMRTDIRT